MESLLQTTTFPLFLDLTIVSAVGVRTVFLPAKNEKKKENATKQRGECDDLWGALYQSALLNLVDIILDQYVIGYIHEKRVISTFIVKSATEHLTNYL